MNHRLYIFKYLYINICIFVYSIVDNRNVFSNMQHCFEQFMKIRLALIHYENEEKIYPFEKFQNVTLHRRKQTRYITNIVY